MENTEENKRKFFAQYWGQEVGFSKEYNSLYGIGQIYDISVVDYLLLKPLNQITDEDLININFFEGNFDEVNFEFLPDSYEYHWKVSGILCNEGFLALKDFDYLRSKGYALPWMGLSIEKLIEYGWIKIK